MNNNFPTIDATDVKRRHMLVDLDSLKYTMPGNPHALQSREFYGTEEQIESMKETIKALGLLESPIVRELDDNSGYEVLEGNRRCYVLNLLVDEGITSSDRGQALTKVRVEVQPSKESTVERAFQDWFSLNPEASEEVQLECREHLRGQLNLDLGKTAMVRNTQRLNWSPIEQARSIRDQMSGGVSIEDCAKSFGLAVQTIKTRLSLLNKETEMPAVIKAAEDEEITISVAKLIANVKDEGARSEILETAKGTGEAKPTTDEVKELIDTRHKENVAAGGDGIKAQDRKKRAAKAPKTAVRSSEDLLQTVQSLAATRLALLADADNPVSENAALDLKVAIQVLQWVLDPKDDNDLETIVLGDSSEED